MAEGLRTAARREACSDRAVEPVLEGCFCPGPQPVVAIRARIRHRRTAERLRWDVLRSGGRYVFAKADGAVRKLTRFDDAHAGCGARAVAGRRLVAIRLDP